MERVVVFGCAGSGKTTLSRELATRVGLPLTERDALGVPGSRDYREALGELARQPLWILDGAPYYEDDLIYGAADTVIFLDYPKLLVLWRVLRRTLRIELFRRPDGAHRPSGLSVWRDGKHPLRWAWASRQARHQEGHALIARPDLADADVIHFTRPVQARRWMGQLRH
ncbi:hypothetical protein [Kribbella soli]|uniref:Adenylate kinase family enzyme n=1 Tax=Kribbella soli TaxID=1124743 RepID=A0A4R0HPA0_9ACTN|nr:hypothetical protein [Kribbella soli]TCC11780.1 hypothetical protein E0H45_11185 [Kribbella soli]